jgi:hypothetical protein
MEELEKVLERARKEPLDEEGYAKLKASLETLGYLVQLVENKDTTIHRLRQILFGSSTEKTSQVLPTEGVARQAGNPTVNPKVSTSARMCSRRSLRKGWDRRNTMKPARA